MAEDSEGKRLLGSGNGSIRGGSFGCDVKDIFKANLQSHERGHLEGSRFFLQIFFPERAPLQSRNDYAARQYGR